MKKRFTLALIISLILTFESNACDICGCGVGDYYIGLLPQFKNRFLGFRYHFNSFDTRLFNDPTQFSHDRFQTLEIWGGWNIGNRFQLLAIVPVNFNHQVSDEGISRHSGLGDIMAILNYKVFEHAPEGHNGQQLWIGGGIKFPTGKFKIDPNDPDIASAANNQLGSGSTDILLNAAHNLRINKIAINTQALYKINTTNKEHYHFGNRFTASSLVSYTVVTKNAILRPNAGLIFEHSDKSSLGTEKIDLTGGNKLMGSAGLEINLRKVSFGFNVQLPVTQKFAEDQTKQKVKAMAHISFAF